MKTIYQTVVNVTGGRNGKVKSDDGALELEVRLPKELGGNGEGYTNPEQLFAAGYAACFDSALNQVLRMEKVRPQSPTSIQATVGLYAEEGTAYTLGVKLGVHIPGVEQEVALGLVKKAHAICPYSNATRGNIAVDLEII